MGRQGRTVVEYAAKMNAMGINERSLAGDHNPVADHVAIIGQDKMRLLPGVPAAPTRMVTTLEGDGAEGWGLQYFEELSVVNGLMLLLIQLAVNHLNAGVATILTSWRMRLQH